MPLIDAAELGEDFEDKPVKEGKYDLRILKAEYGPNKAGDSHRTALMIRIEGEEGEGATPINHYLSDPAGVEDSAKRRARMRDLKRFMAVFGWPNGEGIDLENDSDKLVGLTGNCLVTLEEDDTYGAQNRLRLPKIA